jgi:hypothetical protein
MSRKKLINTEIRALESELLGHIDDQIASLTALVGDAEKQSWLAGNESVSVEDIQKFAMLVNDSVVDVILSRENVMKYVRTKHRVGYLLLSRRFRESDFSDQTFDSVLVSAILNADCLSSKINFLNRLKDAKLLYLDDSVFNLCNLFSDEYLEKFKNICRQWVRVWGSKSGNPRDLRALTGDQSAVIGFGINMKYWIETIDDVTDFTEAAQVLLNAYKGNMSHFEALREQLDRLSH